MDKPIASMKDPEKLLKEHKIDTLDVDWLVGARNLGTNEPSEAAASVKTPSHSREGSVDSDDPLAEVPSPKVVPNSRAEREHRARRNSVAATVFNSSNLRDNDRGSSDVGEGSAELRRTKSLSSASGGSDRYRGRRRGSSVSESRNGNGEKKMGFFKSLFSRSKKSKNESTAQEVDKDEKRVSRPSSRRSSTVGVMKSGGSAPKSSGEEEDQEDGAPLARSRTESMVQDGHRLQTENLVSNLGERRESNGNLKERRHSEVTDRDPRLMEFLQYYKSNGYSVASFKEKSPFARKGRDDSTKAASFTIDGNLSEDKNSKSKSKKYDARGRPLPSHPKKSKLPPALKGCSDKSSTDSASDSDSDSSSNATPSSSHKFGAFLKKVTSYGAGGSSSSNQTRDELSSGRPTSSEDKMVEEFDPINAKVVPGLEDVRTLKHVSFATNTYFNDPPQQICSKHPRQGEVEVKPNGAVVIHRLTPEERKKILESTSSGVVVGGTGQLRLLAETGDIQSSDVRKQEQMAPKPASPTDLSNDDDQNLDTQRRSIKLAAAAAAAGARAKGAPVELSRTATNNEEDVGVSNMASRVTIDKPMISRRAADMNSQTSLNSAFSQESLPEEEILPPKNIKIPHDVVYTRCCHLREILPIPATLKQLKKGSTDPIPLLQLRNPRPSMVEVWSFSDFLSIAPVLCLSLDGVTLSVEMLRVILGSLVYKKNFEKLSLRNTPLDHEGWRFLCCFVSRAKSLTALDLTMVPIIKTNVQKPSKSSLKSSVVRMECDVESRKDMNWNLLAASVAKKGGLEEVIISGAQMPLDQFENFIEVACIATQRLGLAYNCLTKEQCDVLGRWIVQSKVTGLDIGFNDLKGKLAAFNNAVLDKIHNKGEKNVFKYISMNCAGLEVGPEDTSENNEVLKLISVLCYCENLKFLDFSNNPKMFPHCMSTLIDCLPVFVNLVRLHLDYDSLSSTEIVMLAEALPLCSRLNYLSLLGTQFDLASCKSLAEAVRKSPSLITLDIDYTNMPPNIKEKISLYTMRNVESELDKVKANNTDNSTDDKDNLSSLQDELSVLLTDKFKDKKAYDKLVEKYIEKVTIARKKIKKVVKDLFDTRVMGQLSTEGKETLIRLCFIDASFEKGIRLLKERHQVNSAQSAENAVPHPTAGIAEAQKFVKDRYLSDGLPANTLFSSSAFAQSGHSALLPFGKADVEEFNPHADDTVELRDEDEESSKRVSSQIREEGDVFKKADSIRKDLETSHSDGAKQIDRVLLGRAAESMDSDQIKNLLLKTDVTTVVDVIDELHNQGYHLHDIFKKHDEAHEKLAALSPQPSPQPTESDISVDKKVPKPSEDFISAKNQQSHKDETKAIDAAYDQVLDNIERDRKHE